ncbi:hypothetical protein L1787_14055 [Acuticoccus sp. M5D2P5]|uniref:hypothetical protein n=1 Tax=Acuticoccus kalidii TaxID=2910977 RepID=UPI001F1CBD57|nr:hypothetical protein [Acuticoccus kalidii]MCF3934529.1 hypothetical protein [Acuticoccus kalidii]
MTDWLDTSQETPDTALPRPAQALWWLKKGGYRVGPEWERAHALCQEGEGDLDHDRVHALSHWIEGDMGNAGYWYRRIGETRAADISTEAQRIASEIAHS